MLLAFTRVRALAFLPVPISVFTPVFAFASTLVYALVILVWTTALIWPSPAPPLTFLPRSTSLTTSASPITVIFPVAFTYFAVAVASIIKVATGSGLAVNFVGFEAAAAATVTCSVL